jgi:hypothetical protein
LNRQVGRFGAAENFIDIGAAKAIGVEFPAKLLALADEVIE